jgi:uncharacterized protein (DUF58 family)
MEKVSEVFTGALLESLARYSLAVRTLTASGVRGEQRSRRKGSSPEYADHRQYAHGDDLRRLDWHALARLDQMLIRLYAAEETLPLELILDASASMDFGSPTKYVTAARVGCALSQIALLNATPVLWRVAASQPVAPVRLSGRNDLGRALRVLDGLQPGGAADLESALRASAVQGPRRRSVVVLTDGYETERLQRALRACRAAGADVYLMLVLTREELDPSLRGEFTFVDAESDAEAALVLDRATLRQYRRRLAEWRGEWQAFTRSHGISLIELDAAQPIAPGLFRQLADGGLLA